jgi:hypothetical protein
MNATYRPFGYPVMWNATVTYSRPDGSTGAVVCPLARASENADYYRGMGYSIVGTTAHAACLECRGEGRRESRAKRGAFVKCPVCRGEGTRDVPQ